MFFLSAAIIFNLIVIFVNGQVSNEYSANNTVEYYGRSEILSRRKRFLIFPEGSSLQLVFCNTFPSINVISDIILFGYTAALAYELPQDPYSPFDHHGDPLHRRMDNKEIFYLNENGKIIYKRPYHRKFIVNPAFAKRSIDSHTEMESGEEHLKTDRKQMHGRATREFLKGERMDRRSLEFHRTSRALLYRKIELMLQGLGGNGKECLLKTLCLVGQTHHHPQGSFFQEIMRAIFTLPKGHAENEDMKDYDIAHWSSGSCDELYPECSEPVKGPEFATVI